MGFDGKEPGLGRLRTSTHTENPYEQLVLRCVSSGDVMASHGRCWQGPIIGYSLGRNSRFENDASSVQGRQDVLVSYATPHELVALAFRRGCGTTTT